MAAVVRITDLRVYRYDERSVFSESLLTTYQTAWRYDIDDRSLNNVAFKDWWLLHYTGGYTLNSIHGYYGPAATEYHNILQTFIIVQWTKST
jgi:hypothetical protein